VDLCGVRLGLEQLLLRLTNEYKAPAIYVTESGSAFPDEVRPDGSIEDRERTKHLEAHVRA
jgi:beta-glucosidase